MASLFAVIAFVPAKPAAANVIAATVSGNASPGSQSASTFGAVALNLGWSTIYDDSTFQPALKDAVLHLDNDFVFNTTGFAQCQLASIQNKPHAQAVAACPNSIVGSGSAIVNNGADFTVLLDVFNGSPPGSSPFVYVNFDVNNGTVNFTVPGTFSPSVRGEDFGTQIDIGDFPNLVGIAFTQVSLSFPNQAPSYGPPFVSARCQSDQSWEFGGDFSFYDPVTLGASTSSPCVSVPAPAPPATTGTGKQAKALKKCKKKYKKNHDKKKFKKCKKKANLLPV
jgi:hypothetical protein